MDDSTTPPPDQPQVTDQSSSQGQVNENQPFDIQAFEATREIAARQAQRLQEIKKELKIYAEQLKDLLENDQPLVEAEQAAKDLTQKVKLRKTEILETTEAKNIKLKITDIKEERSDIEDSLSAHLVDLYQTTGVMEFEDQQGNLWEYDIKGKIKTRKKPS